jgi:hypothetical protein
MPAPAAINLNDHSPGAVRGALQGQGGPMQALAEGLLRFGSIKGIRAAAPLPRLTEDVLDGTVVKVGRQRLALVDDLINAGLVYRLDNWMSVPSLTYRQTSNGGYARRTMMPDSRGERTVLDLDYESIPIFCTWEDFSFEIREILAAERVGAPLDTAILEQCVRNVNEAIEDQAINGATTVDGAVLKINGLTAPGALTSPVNTYAYTGGEAWSAVGHTGDEILADIQSGIDVLVADNYYGPYNLYIPRGYASKMALDFKANGDLTIRERVLELSEIANIRVLDYLPADRTLLVQMTSDVVDVIQGQSPTVVSWTDGPGWNRFWCVMACTIVRWKANKSGGVGFAVGNLT